MWNKIKDSKGFYIALSIFFAIVCWFYVDLTVEPNIQITVRNIPVSFEGLDELRARELMIPDSKNITVTLKFSGQRNALSQLNRNNVTVTVDAASQVTNPGKQSLEYTVSYPNTVMANSVKIKSRSVETIDVSVIRASTKNVPVSGSFTGSAAEGYMADGFQLEYNAISISGEKSLVRQVDHAVVMLEKSGLSANWDGTLPVTLVDQNGNTVDSEQLNLSCREMEVTLMVRKIKEIPLSVTIKAGGGATEKDVKYTISPEKITVAGSEEALDSIDEWNLGTIDLSQVITSSDLTMDISLPEGLSCASGEKTAKVSVKLPDLSTVKKETSNIKLTHTPEGKTVSLVTKSLEVRCRGSQDVLKLLVGTDIQVEVDLSKLEENAYGTCQVPATATVPGFSEIGAVGTYEVSVYVS